MRQIFPTNQINPVEVINNKPITQEQYDALLQQIQEYEAQVTCTNSEFEQLKNDLVSAWTTCTLTADTVNAITACLNCINATTIQANKVCASNSVSASHFQGTTAYVQCLNAACRVNTDVVNATCGVMTTRVDASCVVADDIKVNNAVHYTTSCTDTANITNADITCETVFNSEIQTACIYDLNSDTAQLDIACINTAHIGDADVANQLDTYKFTAEFIKHNQGAQKQLVIGASEFFIEFPRFTNGSYRIIGIIEATGEELISLTVYNEVDNYSMAWSHTPVLGNPYFADIYIYDGKFYAHGYTNGNAIAFYHISDSLDNEIDPTIYSDGWPFDTTSPLVQKYWEVEFNHGFKYFRNVSFANDSAIVSPLNIIRCDDIECVPQLPIYYDTTENVNTAIYQPDQNLGTKDCPQFNRVTLCDNIDPDTSLVTSESLATLPHVNISCTLCNPHLFIGTTTKYNSATLANDAIVVLTDEV